MAVSKFNAAIFMICIECIIKKRATPVLMRFQVYLQKIKESTFCNQKKRPPLSYKMHKGQAKVLYRPKDAYKRNKEAIFKLLFFKQ